VNRVTFAPTVRRAGAVVAVAVALSGCAVSGLAFREDERVDIVEPGDREATSLPVTIRWTADVDAVDGGPYFAVFVDRAPIRPGQSLRALADDTCNRTAGCPDVAYLRDRFVYVTDELEVTVDVLPQRSGQRTSADDRHEATVVLVDAEGRRVGEAAYTVEFTVEDA
jgi:hypothetical protein